MNAFHYFFLLICGIANFSHSYKIQDIGDALKESVPPLPVGDKTYYAQLTRASWYGAIEFCRREGMELASMESQVENNALSNHLMSNDLTEFNFWTSGENFDQSNVWIWLSTGNEAIYTNWAEGKPTTNPDHCIALIHVVDTGYQWSNFDCSIQNYFVCENR